MTQQTQDAGGAGCKSASDQLKEVTNELNEFEAKKLKELQTELDAFVKKQDGLVKDYETKYPLLRDKWCEQHSKIVQLYSAIKCAFPPPSEDWQKIIKDCICTNLCEVKCLEDRIAKRKRCCNGKLQRARDRAKAIFDAAKGQLDALQGLAGKIDGALGDNSKLIAEIQSLLTGPDHAVVLWIFFFKLLKTHRQLAPDDIDATCRKFLDDCEDDKKLCGLECEGCEKDDDGCTTPDDWKTPDLTATGSCHWLTLPKLLLPKNYRGELDCAWDCMRRKKDEFAKAESDYKRDPDDLDSLGKRLDDLRKSLEDEIRACLKGKAPKDNCCKKPVVDKNCEGEQRNA